MHIKFKTIHYVPMEFQTHHPFKYPEHNKIDFERWFRDNTHPHEITGYRNYLPVLWTGYWCANDYGENDSARNKLQAYVSSIDRSKKYFTICQYDDGPMINFKGIDIIVCGMSGGRIDYPIPLLCEQHQHRLIKQNRNLLASFVGMKTHPIREQIVQQLRKRTDCSVSFLKVKPIDFCALMNRSVFALCPRGYGKSSFRIQEAIQYGAIPVYISDEFVFPYNEGFEYGVVINTELQKEAFNNIHGYLESIANNTEMLENIRIRMSVNKYFFTYEGCKQKILQYVNTH